MSELPICDCDCVWPDQGHHPECPVRREIERLRGEVAAEGKLRDRAAEDLGAVLVRLADANAEIERLRWELAQQQERNDGLRESFVEQLAAERQRARLPGEVVAAAKGLRANPPDDPIKAMNAGFRLARDILAAVEQGGRSDE